MTSVATAAILLLVSTSAWTVVLAAGEHSLSPTARILVAASVWVATVTALTGMMISRSRWARRLALTVAASQGILALITEIAPWWWAAAALTAAAAVAVGGPWLNGYVRALPAAAGPPARAVIVPLLLVGAPFAIGISGGDDTAAAVVAGTALATAFWFIRTLPGALLVVRLIWPLVSLVGGWLIGWPSGAVAAAIGVAVSAVAWDASVTRAVVPLVQPGSVVPIPPELAPREVLDAADVDERGKRR